MVNPETCAIVGRPLPPARITVKKDANGFLVKQETLFGTAAEEVSQSRHANETFVPIIFKPWHVPYRYRNEREGFIIFEGRLFFTAGALVLKDTSTVSVPLRNSIEVGSPVWSGLADVPMNEIHLNRRLSIAYIDYSGLGGRLADALDGTPEMKTLAAIKKFKGLTYERVAELCAGGWNNTPGNAHQDKVSIFDVNIVSHLFTWIVGEKLLANENLGRIIADLVPDDVSKTVEGFSLEGSVVVRRHTHQKFYFPSEKLVSPGTLYAVLGRLPVRRDVMRVCGTSTLKGAHLKKTERD